jgi:hypothetical protein
MEALLEFARLNPRDWDQREIRKIAPYIGFRTIWPHGRRFELLGAAIVRFSTIPGFSTVLVKAVDIATEEISQNFEAYQYAIGDRVETAIRVFFEHNGTFSVRVSVGKPDERPHKVPREWRFDVLNTPPREKWRLCTILPEVRFLPLQSGRALTVTPSECCVRIPGLVYEVVCNFQGRELTVVGTMKDHDPENKFFERTVRARTAKWETAEFTIECPRAGVCIVQYWAGDVLEAQQTLVAGWNASDVTRNMDEKHAFCDMLSSRLKEEDFDKAEDDFGKEDA